MNKFVFINTGNLLKFEKPKPTKASTSVDEKPKYVEYQFNSKLLKIDYVFRCIMAGAVLSCVGISIFLIFLK